jgi:hypothetical protein
MLTSLFLGMLNSSSKSIAELKDQLTDTEWERLRGTVRAAADVGEPAAGTPGIVFGSLLGEQL